ncbi:MULTISPECIES: tyrosine-protein phosphatase [unclassified Streptomyces]|uniref:tyrosine-protein phosphatase n=1 Tax=unclassified Streptomyces TaxID=2593676 RepID=UPI00136993C6|nr:MULTISPECIES: tyrosine-protein phosphatase [unclassified Streptomyces]NEA03053.1 tyrosine-protein phosphatase [Streptomyces sp. SID10116]MYY87509.1 protein-tyrosine-phosphatase [Streptomyces sp. SID335]MYZ19594.1 protein-tyrosine-phosphatase [Streptomyces sp. SID337]NDZ90391.1 tyrosine-protein phosphatase [Streptomyces sp. SID10115]NEB50414.1 tyrosine-protein phosphatase [Streptomyces sp. SID339]
MRISRTRTATGLAISALALGTLPAWAAPSEAAAHAAPRHTATASVTAGRLVPLQGAVNVRDVGGHRTYDGERVREGRVYRADGLSKLTDTDLGTLAGLGLTKVIDFRVPAEVQYDGVDRLPAGLSPTARPVTDNGLFTRLLTAIGSRDPVKQEEMLGSGKAAAFMRDVYRTFVTDAANRAQFAATLRDIASSRSPLLYHCTSGKDRTGWTTYLLLRLVGVPERTAAGDYLASNTYRAAYDAKVREGLKQGGFMQNPDLIIPLQEVRADYLDTALAEATQRYGGFSGYLTEGLGLDARTVLRLRDRMVG